MNVHVCLPLVLLSAIVAAGCDNQSANNSTAATTTTPTVAAVVQTETFSGTLSAQGTNVHNFTVAQVGALNVTLTAAGPPPTIFIGIAIGAPTTTATGTICGLIVTNTVQASTVAVISGSVTVPGPFCLQVYDVGNVITDVTYSVSISHT